MASLGLLQKDLGKNGMKLGETGEEIHNTLGKTEEVLFEMFWNDCIRNLRVKGIDLKIHANFKSMIN